jgi:LysM repeat protein
VDFDKDWAGNMCKHSIWIFKLTLLSLAWSLLPSQAVFASPLAQESPPTPSEVIEAVNALRIANGLLPLNPHPVLMQIAQWEANAIAGGAPGHTRPSGLTLGQWLISLGYPLSGDLSLDGYRSENWISIAATAQEAVQAWLGDEPHTNTMLSPYRSDIGAAVAVSDQIYIVLETALQTASGQMQTEAKDILTAIAQGGSFTGGDNSVPQYIIPVRRSTARPDGNVVHKVQYGQSLWSIAITYNTTIDQIRAWNNLGDSIEIYDGQVLLVQRGATQPPPPTNTPRVTLTPFYDVTATGPVSFLTPTTQLASLEQNQAGTDLSHASTPRLWAVIILVIAVVGAGVGTWVTTNRPPR